MSFQVSLEEPTIGQLVASVTSDLSTLVRDEIELAKAELRDEAKAAAKGGAMLGAAGFVVLLAVIMLCFFAVYGLVALGVSTWLAFLIVAVFFLLVAGAIAFLGVRAFKSIKAPERSIRQAKETAALASSDGRAEAART